MTADSIMFAHGSSETSIPTNKIISINFADEPKELTQARNAVVSDRFEDAQASLKELNANDLKGYTVADAVFYGAAADAELALRGKTPIDKAEKKLARFLKTYPNNYHYYPANWLIGDLLIEAGQPDKAVEYYEKIGKAPWPVYRIDAKIAMTAALLAAGKTSEAKSLLEQVTADTLDPLRKVKVELLKAQTLISQDKSDAAIRLIQTMLKTAPTEEIKVNARAYNLLGQAHRRANRPQDALLAFLHVDLLYPGNASTHAESLGNLAELWTTTHMPERARLATETLKRRYPYSRWNK